MTIPMIVMIISGATWFLASKPPDNQPWWQQWLRDMCRIVFAASALVVLWGYMTMRVVD